VSQLPLGVFDSGLGGLTVVHALRETLPHEPIIYLGDTARVPYGTRSAATVVRYARACAAVLTERGVKALVIACNTVSAVAVDVLRAELDMPVIGVVHPGAQAAVKAAQMEADRTGGPPPKIGVLGTSGTIRSGAYSRHVQQLSTRFEVVGQAAPLLVPLVEEGWLEGEVPRLAIRRYVQPLLDAGAGVFVLGCTHYPLLRPIIEEVLRELTGRDVPVVDSAQATAATIAAMIREGVIPRADASADQKGSLELVVTDLPGGFQAVADLFLGEHTPEVRQIDLVMP
jgi:glutamate racemase